MKRSAGVLRKTSLRTPRSHIVGGPENFRIDDSGELLKSAVNRQPRLRPRGLVERCVLPCLQVFSVRLIKNVIEIFHDLL